MVTGSPVAGSQSITILHISDLQFGRNHRFGNLAPTEADAQFDTLFQRLSDDLDDLAKQGLKPQVIVVSGDLAEQGKKNEFADALNFLIKLQEHVGVPRRSVVIVPGNHDINRKLCEAYFSECEGDERPPIEPYSAKWKHYIWLFEQFYKDEKGISFNVDQPWTLWEMDEMMLVVAGLNSTMKESHLAGSHFGWLGERQLRWFEDRLAPFVEKGWFRLGAVHHNALRGAQDDDENLRDADRLQDFLEPHLNLLLHGHTHNSKLGWLSSRLPVLSTGSAALKKDARPDEVPNQYQVIRISSGRLERWTRRYDPEQKRWIGDTRCSKGGDAWQTVEEVLFLSVQGTFPPSFSQSQARPETGPRGSHEAKRFAGDPDFAEHAAEVCRLRYRNSEVDVCRAGGSDMDYLRVRFVEGPIARVLPIGLSQFGASTEQIERFNQQVIAQHRALDPTVQGEIVYGGERASDELIRLAGAAGIRLFSFAEFQGVIDFRSYIQKQTRKLETDLVYPPDLYVPHRIIYKVGRDPDQNDDACSTVLKWLTEPVGCFTLLVGDFGIGKTFLLHEIARCIPQRIPHLVPILIELQNLEKAHNLDILVAQHLASAGELFLDLAAFPYMLREGRIVLLIDGFDELVLRVSYQRATEYLETLLQAAAGRAKIIVSCRTQHFETDQQVKLALHQRPELLPTVRVARLQPFDEKQILWFLENLLGNHVRAQGRFHLIKDIQDLLGLSRNPRMLSFIAALPEEQLRDAHEKTEKITSAELYRLLIERWLTHEHKRAQPIGALALTVKELREAVITVATCLWGKIDRTMRLSELTEKVANVIDRMTEKLGRRLDQHTVTHQVGSSTLLVRDEFGAFTFVHPSVMEWLVAQQAAEQLVSGQRPSLLADREMSILMADFFAALAGRSNAIEWANNELINREGFDDFAKNNALLVLDRLGEKAAGGAHLVGSDQRGKSFAGQNLSGFNFAGADLSGAGFQASDLSNANFSRAILERADLTKAKLSGATLTDVKAVHANLSGAGLAGATLTGADLRFAKLVGASVPADRLQSCNCFGAATGEAINPYAMISSGSVVRSITFSPHMILASAHSDGRIRLWDPDSGQELRVLKGHQGNVWGVAFNADGRWLASAGEDRTVRLWDVSTGQTVHVFSGHQGNVHSVAFGPHGVGGTWLASGSDDRTVRLWDASTGQVMRVLSESQGPVHSVALSPNSKWLASASSRYRVRLWDLSDWQEIGALDGHRDYVMTVAFSGNSKRLASGSSDGIARLWEVNGQGQWHRVHRLTAHQSNVTAVAFNPDGKWLATGSSDKTTRLWDVNTGGEVRVFSGHRECVTSVAFSANGTLLATGSEDRTVRLWDLNTGELMRVLRGHGKYVTSISFSEAQSRLATVSNDKKVRLWDLSTGYLVGVLGEHQNVVTAVAFSATGRWLATGSNDKKLRVWDLSAEKLAHVFDVDQAVVTSMAFSAEGSWLAAASSDKKVRVWEVNTGKPMRVLGGLEYATSVAFSSQGPWLAGASADWKVQLWDLSTGQRTRALSGHQDSVRSVAFSKDGRLLASGSHDNTVRLWDVNTGQELHILSGHRGPVFTVAFSADGKWLASGGGDNVVRLWDIGTGEEVHVITGHQGSVLSVAFSGNGKWLLSGGDDNTFRLWDLLSGEPLATLVSMPEGWAAFTPDGRYKISGNLGGAFWYAINLCRFEPGELDEFLSPGTLTRLNLDEPLW